MSEMCEGHEKEKEERERKRASSETAMVVSLFIKSSSGRDSNSIIHSRRRNGKYQGTNRVKEAPMFHGKKKDHKE